MPYTYLGSPHWHDDPEVREARFLAAKAFTAWNLRKGVLMYSPIVHSHAMSIRHKLQVDWDFWHKLDTAMLRVADRFRILTLPGWQDSKGLKGEILVAEACRIPISQSSLPDSLVDDSVLRKLVA